MAARSVQWRRELSSLPGDPPPMARRADIDDRRALPPRRPAAAVENRLAPRAGEEDFRWLQASTPGSPESGSGTPSPQLWAQPHPHYDRLYPASTGSSPSRAQAIAGYRREMLDLVRGLPEAAYELSLRDIVESRGPSPLPPPPTQRRTPTVPVREQETGETKNHVPAAAALDDEQAKKQSGGKKQGKARKQRTMQRTRSRSVERSVSLDTGLLIKLFMPLSVGPKKKVSPKPAAPKKTKKEKQGKKKKEGEEEWWKKSEFSEAGSSSRTSSTGSSSNSSASRNGNGGVNGGSNLKAPARSRSRKRIGCYGFFRPNKSANGVIEE